MVRQVRIRPFGLYHLQGADRYTLCGLEILGAYAVRETDIGLDLCKLCFPQHEADTERTKKLALRDLKAEAWLDEDEVTTELDVVPNDHARGNTDD